MKSIAVFCGSRAGSQPIFLEQAQLLGTHLANQNITLVYGGAQVGLMGAVADGVLSNQGEVIGVLPHFLNGKEIAHEGLSELILVDTMHERKAIMNEKSEGVIALPGGFGTMEELFEMLTWAQLGLHGKAIGLLNVNGFYDGLIKLVDTMYDQGYLSKLHKEMLLVSDDSLELLRMMQAYKAPAVPQWITEDRT